MWQWLKQKMTKIANYFVTFWIKLTKKPDQKNPVGEQDSNKTNTTKDSEKISNKTKDLKKDTVINILERLNEQAATNPDKEVIEKLIEEAFANPNSAEELLARKDLKKHLNPHDLCQIIMNNRAKINLEFIVTSLNENGWPLHELAKNDPEDALNLLKSRFLNCFSATQMAEIYYAHRKNETFFNELINAQSGTQYPFAASIPPLLYLLMKAEKENVIDTVWKIIASSATLGYILLREIEQAAPTPPLILNLKNSSLNKITIKYWAYPEMQAFNR